MTPEELNERVKSLIADMEEIGARPAYLRGGSYGATPEKWRETDERRNFAYDRLLGDLHGAKTLHAETGRGYKGEYIRLEPRGPGGEAGRTAQAWPADCGEVGLARGGLGGNRPCGSSGRVAFLPDRRGANGNPCRVRLSGIGGAL